jgi:hypothetical protein
LAKENLDLTIQLVDFLIELDVFTGQRTIR